VPELTKQIASPPPTYSARFWWITFARGLLVLVLGVALLAGANTRTNVATFFGVYWILTGVLAIRWALSPNRERIPVLVLVSGIVGLTTGVVVLARSLFQSLLSTELAIDLIGVTAVLVGILRIGRGFRTEPLLHRRWAWDSVMLGTFEVVLGVSLLAGAAGSSWMLDAITAWAIGSGFVLTLDALQLRRVARAGASAFDTSGD
jgi:uncharacterized membrane protein HdeD (DUF308 family)